MLFRSGSVSSGHGGIHAGHSELMFIGSSRSTTSCPRTASVAVDFPHGTGSQISDMASNCGEVWEGKLCGAQDTLSLFFFFFFLSLLAVGSGCREGEEGKGDEGKWPGEPEQSPLPRFYFATTRGYAAMARIRRIQCGRFFRR